MSATTRHYKPIARDWSYKPKKSRQMPALTVYRYSKALGAIERAEAYQDFLVWLHTPWQSRRPAYQS